MSQDVRSSTIKEPDWTYWLAWEEWKLNEAVLLSLNVEPRCESGVRISNAINKCFKEREPVRLARAYTTTGPDTAVTDPEAVVLIDALPRWQNAYAADRRGRLTIFANSSVEPAKFVIWARQKRYSLPFALEEFVHNEPTPREAELQARVLLLERELAALAAAKPQKTNATLERSPKNAAVLDELVKNNPHHSAKELYPLYYGVTSEAVSLGAFKNRVSRVKEKMSRIDDNDT